MKAYIKRMRIYFAEMFPIPQHTLLAFLIYLSIALFAGWAQRARVAFVSWDTLLGAWSVLGLWLVLRLMDELKDEDIDRELFPHRPVPSGRVSKADIKRTLAGAMILYVGAHVFSGAALWTALFVLGYSVLMFKRFFAPELLRRSLIITLVTHNPIVPLMLTQCFVIFAADHRLALGKLRWDLIVAFIVMLWSPLLAWELARKIRSPEEETAYVTYSRLFGHGGAVALTAAIQTISFCIGFCFWSGFSLSWTYLGIFALGLGLNYLGYFRFLLHPSLQTATLKYYAVAFLVSTELAQLLEFGRLVWWAGV